MTESYNDLINRIILLQGELSNKDKEIDYLQNLKKSSIKENSDDINTNVINVVVSKPNKEIQPTFVIPFGNYTASLVNGVWIYKANETAPIAGKKFENPKYKDPVQFNVMEEYEGFSESRYREQLNEMVKGIAIFLKKL